MRELETEVVVIDRSGAEVAGCQLPVIPADANPALREGLERRRTVAQTGVCPCGAVRPTLTRRERREARRHPVWAPVPHAADCPAADDVLGPHLRAWQLGVAEV
jgi:hypothetical protein